MTAVIPVHIRAAYSHEASDRVHVTREAWFHAYTQIYTPEEITALFDGEVMQRGSWLGRRTHSLASYVAVQGDQVIGHIGMAILDNDWGEATSLYVHPHWHGQQTGTRLWQTAQTIFRAHECPFIAVWTLARARSVDFYRKQGCEEFERGVYEVGRHAEPVIGFCKAL